MRFTNIIAAALAIAMPLAAFAAKPKPAPVTKIAAAVPQVQQLQVPPPESMVIMIRSSLLALSQANQTNNYAVLNALGSDSFRTTNPPQRLSENFAAFRANRIDLSPVSLINPQLSAQPAIVDGRLRLVGFFPSQPMQVNYDLSYEASAGTWKLHGLAVNLTSVHKQADPQFAPGQDGLPASR
jgi:hypothetical protein